MEVRRGIGLAIVAVLVSGSALAQPRGRTDGPEGSEYGKGGYEDPGSGPFSLQLNWGAAVHSRSPLGGTPTGAPLFVGGTATFWADERFVMDATIAYLLSNQQLDVLVGPRFRTGTYPVSGTAGVQAGAMIQRSGTFFGLSPNVSAEMLLNDHLLAGLGYAMDIPIGGGELSHRIFMNVGYRF